MADLVWKTIRDRSSHQRYSVRKVIFRNFTKFTRKHLCQSLFFKKVVGLRPATLLKKRLSHKCFPVNFVKFLRTPFLQNTSWQLLLWWVTHFEKIVSDISKRLTDREGWDVCFIFSLSITIRRLSVSSTR